MTASSTPIAQLRLVARSGAQCLTPIMLAAALLGGCISSSSPPPPARNTTVIVPRDSGTTVVCQDGTKPPCG